MVKLFVKSGRFVLGKDAYEEEQIVDVPEETFKRPHFQGLIKKGVLGIVEGDVVEKKAVVKEEVQADSLVEKPVVSEDKDITDMTKEELAAYAQEKHSIKISVHQTKQQMLEKIAELE